MGLNYNKIRDKYTCVVVIIQMETFSSLSYIYGFATYDTTKILFNLYILQLIVINFRIFPHRR